MRPRSVHCKNHLELEDALADRLSFRRFVGLPLDGGVPDETTLCRFRGELVRRGLTERLLAAVDAQLAGRGLVLKRGTLIDASLMEADADGCATSMRSSAATPS